MATLSILGDARAKRRQGVHVEEEATLSIPGERQSVVRVCVRGEATLFPLLERGQRIARGCFCLGR